jgi:hypothetical protein
VLFRNKRDRERYQVFFFGDEFGFDRASNNPTATSEATDLISANKVNANDDSFTPMALAA